MRYFSLFEQLYKIVSTAMNIGINFLSFMVMSEFLFQVTVYKKCGALAHRSSH